MKYNCKFRLVFVMYSAMNYSAFIFYIFRVKYYTLEESNYSYLSSSNYFLLLHNFLLFLRKCSKELYFFFICWFPLVVSFECTSKMCFNFNIKCLWFYHGVWSVVYSRNCLCRYQVM